MSLVPIYTIGYGTREIAQLLAILRTHEIAYLLDVRSQPYSRYKPDFSQDALIRHLAAAGIRYVFMGDALGGKPEDPNCYTNGQVDYDKIAQQPFYQAGIRRLKTAYEQQQRVVLLCSEGKPEQCHRALLIGRSLAASGIALAHIDEQDRLLSQAAVLARLHGDQLPLLPPAGSQPETTAPLCPHPNPISTTHICCGRGRLYPAARPRSMATRRFTMTARRMRPCRGRLSWIYPAGLLTKIRRLP